MKESLQNIRDIIVKPSAAFTRLKAEPKWLLAFTLCCLGFIAVEWATLPFEAHLLSQDAAQEEHTTNKPQINDSIIDFVGIAVVSSFMILILLILLGIFLLAVARLFRINRIALKLSHIYASVVHLTLIGMLGKIVNTVLLLIFKSPQDMHSELDMIMIPGLHHVASFVKNEEFLTFLSSINPFSLWQIALCAIAIKVLVEVDELRALFAAIFIWLGPAILAAIL